MKIILKSYMHKEYFGEEIVELHYVFCHNNPKLNVNPKFKLGND